MISSKESSCQTLKSCIPTADKDQKHRIHPAVSHARAPEGFSEDPLLWFPKQQDEVCQSQADIQDTGKAEV